MDEGTKLSTSEQKEDNVSEAIDSTLKKDTSLGVEETKTATKLGEVSEFEKSLNLQDASVSDVSQKVTENDSVDALNSSQQDAFESQLNLEVLDCQEGDVVRGTVLRVERGSVYIDIHYKAEAVFDFDEIKDDVACHLVNLEPGEDLDVLIEKLETREGYTKVSYKKARQILIWNQLEEKLNNQTVVSVIVKNKVEGGLIVNYSTMRGFVPMSHLSKDLRQTDIENLIDKKIDAILIKVDLSRKKVVFSNRLAEKKSQESQFDEKLTDFEEGKSYKGKVSSLTNFGAFIDLGGIEGLVHISEMSWSRISHPSEVVSVGDEIEVLILAIDRDAKRISLGLKQLISDPWADVEERFKIGSLVEGEVSRIVTFGAFIQLGENLEGLVHISELSYNLVKSVDDVLKVGEKKTFKVIRVKPEEQKIGLSLKQLETSEATQTEEVAEVESAQDVGVVDSSDEVAKEVSSEEAAEDITAKASTEADSDQTESTPDDVSDVSNEETT